MLAMAATVGTALVFQYLGRLHPVQIVPGAAHALLCRRAADGGGAALVGAWLAGLADARLLLLAGGLLMVYSLYLGIHHAGVEWGWWAGPTDCGAVDAGAGSSSGGVLDQIDTVIPPSCDKASLRILGLSFAGWNAVASFFLALVALRGAFAKS